MNPEAAILAYANRQLPLEGLFRAFNAHPDWRAPLAPSGKPTLLISDAAMTPTAWLLSSEAAHAEALKRLEQDSRLPAGSGAAAVGPVGPVPHLDAFMAALDPRVQVLRIDPGSRLALHIQTDELAAFRVWAGGAGAERAMAERRYGDVRRHGRYFVPYFGVLGQGHNVIALPTGRGQMVAAFTTTDAVEAFLATGSDENRARVKFVQVNGDELFGSAGPTLAEGVIVNIAGPKTFGFDREACREVAGA